MGRGRGKGKKQSVHEDLGSGEEDKIPIRRRGRPLKPSKDEIGEEEEEEEAMKMKEEENNSENTKGSVFNKDVKNQGVVNGKKRKRTSQVKEVDSTKVENGVGNKTNSNELIKSVGFRQNGSRRKNKPRRAAEVGVECR
uniref:Putative neurofilament medium polypeptide-like n=1 Tax=Solanum chacoense TaxID=4108 RepID=A0A0V0I532_SOLCH